MYSSTLESVLHLNPKLFTGVLFKTHITSFSNVNCWVKTEKGKVNHMKCSVLFLSGFYRGNRGGLALYKCLDSFSSFLQEIFIRWSTDKKWTEAEVRDRWIRRNGHWRSRSVTELWKLLSSSESCYHSSGQINPLVCGRKPAHERS